MFSTGDTPDLHGVRRFHANMGAARSAHVLVVVHGAGAVNSFFMEGNGKGEVRVERRDTDCPTDRTLLF